MIRILISVCICSSRMASTLFPEILRSAQKDETILNQMSGEFSRDFWLKILGPKTWLKYNQWIEAFNHFVYFTCTTLSDLQTPGEEYTGLVQVVQDYTTRRPKLPSKMRRLLMVFGQTFGPVCLKHLISKYWSDHEQKLRLNDIVDTLGKVNLLWFYCEGLYYHLSKRFLGISYLRLRPSGPTDNGLQWIQWLSLVNIALLVYQFWKKSYHMTRPKQDSTNLVKNTTGQKCALCLETRTNPTCTLCGHIFCWQCIHESLQTRDECPLCREKISPRQLIPLINYS